jgi:hypothetical protein
VGGQACQTHRLSLSVQQVKVHKQAQGGAKAMQKLLLDGVTAAVANAVAAAAAGCLKGGPQE